MCYCAAGCDKGGGGEHLTEMDVIERMPWHLKHKEWKKEIWLQRYEGDTTEGERLLTQRFFIRFACELHNSQTAC